MHVWIYKISHLIIREGGAEVVRVEVAAGLHMCDTDGLPALDGHSALARPVGLPPNSPITVGIIRVLHARYRLLPAT